MLQNIKIGEKKKNIENSKTFFFFFWHFPLTVFLFWYRTKKKQEKWKTKSMYLFCSALIVLHLQKKRVSYHSFLYSVFYKIWIACSVICKTKKKKKNCNKMKSSLVLTLFFFLRIIWIFFCRNSLHLFGCKIRLEKL